MSNVIHPPEFRLILKPENALWLNVDVFLCPVEGALDSLLLCPLPLVLLCISRYYIKHTSFSSALWNSCSISELNTPYLS